eukprot:scaffold1178_cov252-Pinguiococcus_pyrenoidosus.AAC.35
MVDDHALDAHADLEHLLDVGHAIVGDLGDVEQGADAVHIHEGSVGLDGLDFAFKKITPADGRHLLLEDGTAVRHDQFSQLRVHLQELDAEGLAHKIVVELGGQVRARHEAADALNVHEAAAAVRPEHSGVHDHILRLVLDHAVPGLAELDLLDGDKQLARDLVLADDFKLALLPDAHDVLHGAHRAEARLLLREQRCRLGPDLERKQRRRARARGRETWSKTGKRGDARPGGLPPTSTRAPSGSICTTEPVTRSPRTKRRRVSSKMFSKSSYEKPASWRKMNVRDERRSQS